VRVSWPRVAEALLLLQQHGCARLNVKLCSFDVSMRVRLRVRLVRDRRTEGKVFVGFFRDDDRDAYLWCRLGATPGLG